MERHKGSNSRGSRGLYSHLQWVPMKGGMSLSPIEWVDRPCQGLECVFFVTCYSHQKSMSWTETHLPKTWYDRFLWRVTNKDQGNPNNHLSLICWEIWVYLEFPRSTHHHHVSPCQDYRLERSTHAQKIPITDFHIWLIFTINLGEYASPMDPIWYWNELCVFWFS